MRYQGWWYTAKSQVSAYRWYSRTLHAQKPANWMARTT